MRKDGWAYWTTGLPDDSEALEDLQRLADELGVTKAEANRLLLIAYSKAIHGKLSQLWGFNVGSTVPSPYLVEAPMTQNEKAENMNSERHQRRRRSAAAAANVVFDMDG